jgi:phosphate:Na+ symporter
VSEIHIWPLLAGLGLFLFGMNMLESALKALSGRTFKLFLRKQTGNTVKAILAGGLTTAVLQSSSMVTLLVMSFAGAGILGLKNGIGMILGANLGTTATGWLVALLGFKLNIQAIVYPIMALGGLLSVFLKSETGGRVSRLLLGFAFLFLGLGLMKDGFAGVAEFLDPEFLRGKPLVLFLLFGFVLTALIQSSSASMTIYLASLSVGMISLEQAAVLVIGSDLGTTVTALIGTLRANEIRRKVGWSQFYFNFFNMFIAVALVKPVLWLFKNQFGAEADPLILLVGFHSAFNLVGIFVVAPMLPTFTAFINRIVKGKGARFASHIPLADPDEAHTAIEALEAESLRFIRQTIAVNRSCFDLFATTQENPYDLYSDLKHYENEIASFYVRILKYDLDSEEAMRVSEIIGAIRNASLSAKDVKDIRHNLVDLKNAVSQSLFLLNNDVRRFQERFYRELELTLASELEPDTKKLSELAVHAHLQETDRIYQFYNQPESPEMEVPSLLNLVREINKSNDALIRSTQYLKGMGADA